MNWRESLLIAIRQGTSAEDAKAPSVADGPGLSHLLHTDNAKPQIAGLSDEGPDRETNGALGRPTEPRQSEPLEDVLKGLAVELWSDLAGERLFIVADEEDAAKLGEPRGTIYTAPEVRKIISIRNPEVVAEIHNWKRTFIGKLRECRW